MAIHRQLKNEYIIRDTIFKLLNDHNKIDLFPKELLSIEKGAKSNLANWLQFPTELDGCPDEIEHIKKITIRVKDEDIFYHVFKFRINEPHWAAKNGWMIGVVGPYLNDSKPYDFTPATFSRLNKFETNSPDEEAKWVHENIAMKR